MRLATERQLCPPTVPKPSFRLYVFANTNDDGPVVIDLPPAANGSSLLGTVADAWQVPLTRRPRADAMTSALGWSSELLAIAVLWGFAVRPPQLGMVVRCPVEAPNIGHTSLL